jgi:hypothetical protein
MAQTVAHLTPRTPDATTATFDPERILETDAPYFRAAPSPLSLLHPDHAGDLARFLSLEAGWTVADLELLGGDPLFRAEVAGVMAVLEASGPG